LDDAALQGGEIKIRIHSAVDKLLGGEGMIGGRQGRFELVQAGRMASVVEKENPRLGTRSQIRGCRRGRSRVGEEAAGGGSNRLNELSPLHRIDPEPAPGISRRLKKKFCAVFNSICSLSAGVRKSARSLISVTAASGNRPDMRSISGRSAGDIKKLIARLWVAAALNIFS